MLGLIPGWLSPRLFRDEVVCRVKESPCKIHYSAWRHTANAVPPPSAWGQLCPRVLMAAIALAGAFYAAWRKHMVPAMRWVTVQGLWWVTSMREKC